MANLTLPGNPRYQPKSLQLLFGYDHLVRAMIEVEVAALGVLGKIGVIPKEVFDLLTPEIKANLFTITTSEVDKMEREVTKHDIRALVRLIQEKLPESLRPWVHVPLTSYDVVDTARVLQFRQAHCEVVYPLVRDLCRTLAAKVIEYADTIQIGRTHGQHALPITVGFWLASILKRVFSNLQAMDLATGALVGKISGAVGAYNAQVGLGIDARCGLESFERRVLAKLSLCSGSISTQILPPEPLAHYLFVATLLSGSLAQFGRDCRHLMRTEIGEIGEPFEAGQVGSSTMAHKRNPINFENLEGMHLRTMCEFQKVMLTLVSEHQRDLVGSSVARDFPIIIVNVVQQLETLSRPGKDGKSFLERITVDVAACRRNFALQSNVILAEPMYLALQMAGYTGDAHELVNHQLMPLAREKDITLSEALNLVAEWGHQEAVSQAYHRIPPEVKELLSKPESYTGHAAKQARQVAAQVLQHC